MDEFIKKLDRDFSRLASAVVLGTSKHSIEQLEAFRLRIHNIQDIANKVEEAQNRRENAIDLKVCIFFFQNLGDNSFTMICLFLLHERLIICE